MRTWQVPLGVLLGLWLWPRAGAAEVVRLAQLEQLALRNRPALAAGAARQRAAQAEIDKAQSGYYPKLSLQAQSVMAPGRALVTVTDVNNNAWLVQGSRKLNQAGAFDPQVRDQLGLELDANLYDFGRTAAALEAGRARYASAEAEEEATRLQIVRAVRGAYLSWLSASELDAIAEQAAQEAQSRREHVEALIGEGVRPKSELSSARADEMLAKLEQERAQGDLRAAKLALAQTVGSELAASAEPDRTLLQIDMPLQPARDDATQRALALQQQAANASARAQAKADAPLLTGNAQAGLSALNLTPFPAYAVGVGFSLPLWDGGSAKAGAAAARAHAEELGAQLQQHAEQRKGELAAARLDASNAVARLQTAQALLQACVQRVSEAEQGYELGAATLDQVAQARALLRRAKTEVVLARISRAEAALRIAGR